MSIITISRGTFSGGEAVARMVAERLGYRCLGREEVLEAAWGYGVAAGELAVAMDKRPPLWKRVAGERTTHLTLVRAALSRHAREDNLVYHGHLGHFFLPGIRHVLSVRVIADVEFRIAAAMQLHTFGRKEAIAYLERVDQERKQWTQFLFDVDWDDSHLYDLVVNLGRTSIATAAEAVAKLAQREEFQPTPASRKAIQDLALQSTVEARLATDPRTRGLVTARVAADEGVVTVTGTTQSLAVVDVIPVLVREIEGVREVKSGVRLLREGSESI